MRNPPLRVARLAGACLSTLTFFIAATCAFAALNTPTVLTNADINTLIRSDGILLTARNFGSVTNFRGGVIFAGTGAVGSPSGTNWSTVGPSVATVLGSYDIDSLFFSEIFGPGLVTLTYSNLNPASRYVVQILHGEPRVSNNNFANNDFVTSAGTFPVPAFSFGDNVADQNPPSPIDRVIVEVTLSGVSNFTYRMKDGAGRGPSIAGFQVREVGSNPPTVIMLPPTGTNAIATLKATVNPNLTPTTAWFEWGPSAWSIFQRTAPMVLGSDKIALTVSSPLSGLFPGMVYRGRVVASNEWGVVRGQDVLFGSPAVTIAVAAVTNECHFPLTNNVDATGTNVPLAIAANDQLSLALKYDGTVAVWGGSFNAPTNVPGNVSNLVAIAAGSGHVLGLSSNGMVVAWGDNTQDQTNIPPGLSNVVAIAAGIAHSLALKSDGTVVAWGWGNYGQTSIPLGLSNVVAVAGGSVFSMALKGNGTVVVWGNGSLGETTIPAGLSNVVAIAAGNYHCLALKSDGTVAAWGGNNYGQTNVPVGLSNVVAITAGNEHSLALKSNGTVVGWGRNLYGQTSPPASWSNVVAIAAGYDHSLALKSDGTFLVLGNNFNGQTNIPPGLSSVPVTASGAVDVNTPESYPKVVTGRNSLGGVGTASYTVVVKDTLPPVITLLGNNPLLITNSANLPLQDPGATASDLCGGAISALAVSSTVNANFPGTYAITYRFTDANGNTATNSRSVIVSLPPAVPGDQNGDGVVSQSELDTVYSKYVANSPWLLMTNVAGLGGSNVTFALSNSVAGSYTVECSTNMATWQPLGPATPRYLFTDTNAPTQPQRYYRLRYP